MNLLILHLSDLHINTDGDGVLLRGDAVGRAAFKDLTLADAVVVLLSGDIAFSGKPEQYQYAKRFLDQIAATIRTERDVPLHVMMCPGNHDCDFDTASLEVRDIVIDRIKKTPPDQITDALIDTCTAIQGNFFAFREQFNINGEGRGDKLWFTYNIRLGEHSVAIHCLNLAWMSSKKEEPGAIAFPIQRYESIANTATNTSIICMHHPLNWFAQPSYRPFRQCVRKVANLILTGHEHVQSAALIDDTDSGESVALDGGVLQGAKDQPSTFNTIFLDLDKQEYSISFLEWSGDCYAPKDLESTWASFKRLPEKRRSEFSTSGDFLKFLNDPGARFTPAGKVSEVILDDIYVFPELRPLNDDEKDRLVVDSGTLRNPGTLARGVFIKGREQYGKTSLLKQLFRSYQERGFVPLLISGKDIGKSTQRDMQKTVDAAVVRIYGASAPTKFWQIGCEQRVLLLDDLDESRLTGDYLARALEYMNSVFGLMVITASELFELRELMSRTSDHLLMKLDHFELLEFGHRLRFHLIRRWSSLAEAGYSLERMVGTIDNTEKLVTNVIGDGVVPSTPFFLLTLLQSIEAGSTANLQQSALGDYYRYLIIHSLELQRVPRDEYNEILNYCSYLAWFLYKASEHSASSSELEQFHDAFVQRHGLSMRFETRKSLLLGAHLLSELDGGFSFQYPYLYYFFLGKYLADHLGTDEVQDVVRECCKQLYQQDNGNIILFLAHHSRDERVYESVLVVLQAHYKDKAPVILDGDVDVVNQLVEAAPQLVFVDGDVIQHRDDARKHQDESQEENGNRNPDPSSLPPEILEIMSLVRTISILGQFLKNHYGQLEAGVKEMLIKELFDGGMRGMRNLFELLLEHSEGLISGIEVVLEKRGLEDNPAKRTARAKKEMFWVLSLLAFGFINRCGVSVASPHLARVIGNVVDADPNTAFRLISSVADLEKQGGLDDLSNLKRLNQSIKGNAVAQSVLQRIVLSHMHLYATTGVQKQKVCAELNIRMEDQLALDFKTKDSKRA